MKQFEKVFTNLWIKLEQTEEGSPPNKTDELAKSTSWADIIVKCYQILEAWGKILDENPINQADKPSIMDVALILGSNLVLNNPINQADKPNVTDVALNLGSNLVLNNPINQADKPNIMNVALNLGTKSDNQASVKSRDVSLKVSGFSLSLPESPGFAPILT